MATDLRATPEAFAARLERDRAVRCDAVFDLALQQQVLRLCKRATFTADRVERLGDREIEQPMLVSGAIRHLLARGNMLRWIEAATGCKPLTDVAGQVVRTHAGIPGHLLNWHDDLADGRRQLAIVINLSDTAFEGGLFEIRDAQTQEIRFAHHHRAIGSALLFAVDKALEHRVRPVTSGGPRCVFTGWFMSETH